MNAIPVEKKEFIDEFLKQPQIARIATVDKSGQPHVVPVWFGWDGESLWISSYSDTQKNKHISQNPKIAVAIDVAGNDGETKAVIFEGTAELVTEPKDFLQKQFYWIYHKYLGDEGVMAASPQEWIKDPLNTLIKLTPSKVNSWNW